MQFTLGSSRSRRTDYGARFILLLCLIVTFQGLLIAHAHAQGSLDPTNPPAPSMRTLDQIYNAIATSAPAAAGTGGLVTFPPATNPPLPHGATDAALYLELDGDDILGDNPNTSVGREDSIYVLAYGGSVSRPAEGGPLTVAPICILKPIDRSSPLLVRGVILNQPAQGEIRFFRLNTMGTGATEHFYSVNFSNGRIIRHEQVMPGYELVVFTFGTIEWTYTDGGVTTSYTVP